MKIGDAILGKKLTELGLGNRSTSSRGFREDSVECSEASKLKREL